MYDIRMTAKDRAGHESRQDSRVIVDQSNPVIRYVDQMQGYMYRIFNGITEKKRWYRMRRTIPMTFFWTEHSTPQGKNNKGRSEDAAGQGCGCRRK